MFVSPHWYQGNRRAQRPVHNCGAEEGLEAFHLAGVNYSMCCRNRECLHHSIRRRNSECPLMDSTCHRDMRVPPGNSHYRSTDRRDRSICPCKRRVRPGSGRRANWDRKYLRNARPCHSNLSLDSEDLGSRKRAGSI